jgi:beta-lactamase regulating signal transducer with metallopeptidase domain
MTAWLLTWLWQGLALTAVVAAALRCTPRLNAATKHLIWCAALVALWWLGWAGSPEADVSTYRGLTPILVQGSDPIYIPSAPDVLISIFLGIWAAVALVNLLRLLPGLGAIYALRDCCQPFPPDIEGQLRLWHEVKARGRRTDLMICDAVPGATVLGFQRPCIAIPSSVVDALTIDELDQVILHEHAHVQRRDDWSRLVQTLLLSVLWIHPAAQIISRALSRECEMACDEWVVARTFRPKAYARCLAHAAEVRGRNRGRSALVPAFVGRRHELVRRVDRLLTLRGQVRRKASLVAAVAAAMVMAVVSLQLQGVRFAEIADLVLPHVAGPRIAIYKESPIAIAETPVTVQLQPVRLEPNTTDVRAAAPLAPTVFPGSAIAFDTTNAPVAPSAPVAPITSSVAFAGVYLGPDAPATASAETPRGWSALGAPGVEVALAAKKTSIGIANVFSRAGVSLARSF